MIETGKTITVRVTRPHHEKGVFGMSVWGWIVLILIGAVVGLLGKFIAPGDKDNIPLWATVLCGVGGILLGNVVYEAFGGNGSEGLDWTQGVVVVLTAVVLVMIVSTVLGRNTRKV